MKTKNYSFVKWTLSVTAAFLMMTGCNQDLKDDVDDLKNRVTTLEESVVKLDEAISQGKLITAVTPVASTATNPGGWVITFSDKSTIDISNGAQGAQGNQGIQGPQGPQGETPYIWINERGNWASNLGSKPADSNAAKYEIQVNGQSVKAQGVSVRVVNKDGFIAFEEYDAATSTVLKTTLTTFPFEGGKVITAIVETDESVTFTIDGKSYCLAKAGVYPTSITVIRDKDYILKGGRVEFKIAVNPSTSKVYEQAKFGLHFDQTYTRAYGNNPDFIKIASVEPCSEAKDKGQYIMTLEWAKSFDDVAKDAAIFIVLNYSESAYVISSTPLIINEKYRSITDRDVQQLDDVVLFSDETFTDSVRLSPAYHQDYVSAIEYSLAGTPMALKDMKRYITPGGDKFKFTVLPVTVPNVTVWPEDTVERSVTVTASVTDKGVPAVPVTPAKPEIGQPAVPGIPAIEPVTIDRDFLVTVYRAPADGVIETIDYQDKWLPNRTVNYVLESKSTTTFTNNGYKGSAWNFAIKTQELFKKEGQNWTVTPMKDNITADVTGFNAANGFTAKHSLLPTINAGTYKIVMTITATAKTQRPAELKQSREFKLVKLVNIVAPKFKIYYKGGHTLIGSGSDTYYTTSLLPVAITDLFDVESNENISKASDVTPNAAPLAYDFATTSPSQGAQGVQFSPYPTVTAPAIGDWGSKMSIKKSITAHVKLVTGQSLPISILCREGDEFHATSELFVSYTRLNLKSVAAKVSKFNGNYSAMKHVGINIATSSNFTPLDVDLKVLHPTMIESISYSAVGNVKADAGQDLPDGLQGKQILQINGATGVVTSIDGITWQNPDAVLYQVFRVTYKDIWSNTASKDVNVYVKSNSVPSID
ncbi:MAG: hypothetical protein RR410_07735 [Alistipes sp.]